MITFEYLRKFLYKITKPKSESEDDKRREFILNILLINSIVLLLIGSIVSIIDLIIADPVLRSNNALSLSIPFAIFFIFLVLYFFSRKGFFRFASYSLFAVFYLLASYMEYRWGVDLPSAILLNVIVVIMAGILISTSFAFYATAVITATMVTIGYLQRINFIRVNQYWKNDLWTQADLVMIIIIYFIIATVSWLSNREIEKSLARARKSEAELKAEHISLEIKVEERTAELKKAQIEQISQLYRFAEFGKLSSGLFHDLINPLTAACLNIEQIKKDHIQEIQGVKSHLDKAVTSIKRMENFIVAVKKQMTRQKTDLAFSLAEEINAVIHVLEYKAKKANVAMIFLPAEKIMTYGDPTKFNQIVLNLIANSIDSYSGMDDMRKERKIEIRTSFKDGIIHLTVRDWGCGIAPEFKNKIFQPFFTTKSSDAGTGIGLSLIKRIVENDFEGTIKFKSEKNKGTKFIIAFPKHYAKISKNI